jgi:hypothetical protein
MEVVHMSSYGFLRKEHLSADWARQRTHDYRTQLNALFHILNRGYERFY